ncbi:cadherin domain-containing protein [Rhizorhabdus dicambivorans]|uniref:Cadherin domain-containing protein n=2 Tax=Rhizorhabdus dicambivorans TaxID=1850238 RepID=A0A2A4FS58_9SPHN|nr:cadherin domain-containing protein [Rhizorhabdus dicambivorans]PCE40522.1 cadherin domain-containing protein [Rhizorhabdus dicambivorans]
MLAACGGGGSSGGGGSANRAPSFTSGTTASVAENSSGTVYTAAATDPDGNSLTYSLVGGPDRNAFQISASGALSFVSSPDFEAPADANGDNVYQVDIQASDGSLTATLSLSITVTNGGNDAFRVRRAGTGFVQPVFVAPVPDNSGRVFVVQRGGLVRILNPATGAVAAQPFLDVSGIIASDGERGLLGFATAPDFANSGAFFIYMTNSAGTNEVRRYTASAGNRDVADPASGDIILSMPHPGFSNHNGGWIGFGPDNLLYVATGDGGGAGDPNGNAQNRNSLLGKILRIDVRSDGFSSDPARDYAIPPGNPFASSGGAPELWALGLRNPFRNSFDPVSGFLLIGDVGQGAVEEIDLMRPTDGGANFGWNLREGSQAYNGGANSSAFTPPVAEYGHGSGPTQGNTVTGGHVYRGPVEGLRGHYVFGDFISGNIWSIPLSRFVLGQTVPASQFTIRNPAPNAGTIGMPVSFGVDQSGNLYIVDFDGEIFVIEPA